MVANRDVAMAPNISVSPLAGVPTLPQLALSFQLPETLLPPDQLRVLPWPATGNRLTHTATITIKCVRIGELDENRIEQFVFFIGAFLRENSFVNINIVVLDE